MASSYDVVLEQALADYERQRARAGEVYRELNDISETVTAPRQVVKVTVGQQGEVTDLTFPTAAFKNLTATELAAVIVKTINQAHAQVRARAATVLAPDLPDGISPEDLVSGKIDLGSLIPASPRFPEVTAETESDQGARTR